MSATLSRDKCNREQSHRGCTKCHHPANCLGRTRCRTNTGPTGKCHQLSCKWKKHLEVMAYLLRSIKCGKPVILKHLHKLLKLCWSEKAVLRDMCDSNTINLYKNKGNCSDCSNYWGISLLLIVGKVYAQVMLKRLQILATCIYPES